MKAIIVIPCLNEEATLPLVLSGIPKEIPSIDTIEVLVVDDGSSDRTVEVARSLGVQHFVRFKRNRGLASAFKEGTWQAIRLGADIIVTTDGDNQYPSESIPSLIEPIIHDEADMVIGDRQTSSIEHFSRIKRILQSLGTGTVRKLTDTDVRDAVSGFRAYSRDAILRLNVVTEFSHNTEVIFQAASKKLSVVSVPIQTNPKTRDSRLFGSIFEHVRKSGATIIRAYAMYQPLKIFLYLGILLFLVGVLIGVRFLFNFIVEGSSGNIQSLILSAILMIIGMHVMLTGIVADLVATNRKLLEEILVKLKVEELERGPEQDSNLRGTGATPDFTEKDG